MTDYNQFDLSTGYFDPYGTLRMLTEAYHQILGGQQTVEIKYGVDGRSRRFAAANVAELRREIRTLQQICQRGPGRHAASTFTPGPGWPYGGRGGRYGGC